MSVRYLHIVCATLLMLAPPMFLQSCSSAQQEDGDLEAEQQNAGGEQATEEMANGEQSMEEGNQAVAEEGGEQAVGEEGENVASENMAEEGGEEQLAENGQLDNQVLEGNQTKSDLEDIIAGQNAEQPTEEIPAESAPVADASAPVDAAPMADPAAAPVADAGAPPAAAMSAGPALPEQGSKMPYIVRVGETLSTISRTIYGNADRWSEIAELSSIKNPNLVRPGDVVYYQLSQETVAFATAYEGAPRNEVTIQAGDTLAGIAQRVYGNQGDWKFVWRQNSNIDNPDRLEVGQTIYYLSPAAFSAAFEYAKSIKIVDLLKNLDNSNNQETETSNGLNAGNASDTVSGFELAVDMLQVFATNFSVQG